MRILLCLSYIIGSVLSQHDPCPQGWVNLVQSCYHFVTDTPKEWREAEFSCGLMHSRLVEIETVVEEDFLRLYLTDNKLTGSFWMGFTDISVEGEWVWTSTQATAHYTDWFPNEPNNSDNEDCATITQGYSFHWNDESCSVRNNFICEMESHRQVNVIG